MFQNNILDRMSSTTSVVLGSTWAVLFLRVVMQDAVSRIHMYL